MTTSERELVDLLAIEVRMFSVTGVDHRRAGLLYNSGQEFVLRHGDFHEGKWPKGKYQQGVPRMCFGNAIVAAEMHGLRYVEGFATAANIPLAIPHAWNLDDQGNLVDVTWLNTGSAYLGVVFSIERADDATWNGDSCVLNDWKRSHPLLRQRWSGEDFTLSWPPSERLDVMRMKDRKSQFQTLMKLSSEAQVLSK